MRQRERSGLVHAVLVGAAVVASSAPASERELEQDSPPNSAREIETSIERVFPEEPARPPLVPWFGQQLQKLPPFFADTHLEVHFRTNYLRKDRVTDELSEAWAAGGSIAYRSGWLADLFQAELEAFTSQPIVAPDSRDGTLLLAPGQEGYGVLGIAKGKLRYEGIVLTGFRQYLDHVGTIVGAVPDLFVGAYAELGVERNLADAVEGRLDVQLTYQGDIGDDLLGDDLDETWNLGTRASTSAAMPRRST